MQHSEAISLFQIMKIDTVYCGNHINEFGKGLIHLNTKSYAMIYYSCELVLGNNQKTQLHQQAADTSRLLTQFDIALSTENTMTTISAALKTVISAGHATIIIYITAVFDLHFTIENIR